MASDSRLVAGIALTLLLVVSMAGAAATEVAGPVPPCGEAPQPAYPDPGAPPKVELWRPGEVPSDWQPPACSGWTPREFKLLIALAGSFQDEGTFEDLLGRFAAVSSLTGIRYWSVSDKAWQPLVTEAAALNGPDPSERRADFTAAELTGAQDVFFAQSDNRSSREVVYRMRLLEVRPDRLVVQTENTTAVTRLFTLFGPGDIQVVYFFDRRAPSVWNYYSLTRTKPLSVGYEASYVNRAVALYRHLAGIPTDRDPPLAP